MCVCVSVSQGRKVCSHLTCGKLTNLLFGPENTSSPNCTLARTHTRIQLMRCFLKGSSFSRGGTSLLAATYDPPSPTIHTHTQAPGNRPSPSLFIQSLISFHQVCLFPFSHLHLSTQLDTLLCQIPIPPSLPASTSLSALLHIFVFFPLSSPASFLLLLFYRFHHWLSSVLRLLFASFSQYSPPSLGLPSLFLCPLFFALFTAPLSAYTLLLPLSSYLTSHPLFSPCRSLSRALFWQPLSPSLWVSGLCGGSAPGGTSTSRIRLENKLWDRGGRGAVEEDWKKDDWKEVERLNANADMSKKLK